MPPDSPALQHEDGYGETPPLTDENVEILYQIIRSAEQSPEIESQPFRAIFSAYDRVLPENGLDSNHDQVYLRFLFRLGDRREDGAPLFEVFERLLDELGIQIEFNSEDDDIQELTRNIEVGGNGLGEEAQNIDISPKRARRRSLQSAYDAEDEDSEILRSPTDSRASDSRLHISQRPTMRARPASRATTRPTERPSNPTTPRKSQNSYAKKRLTALEWTLDLERRQRDRRLSAHMLHLQDNPGDDMETISSDHANPRTEDFHFNDNDQPIEFQNTAPRDHPPLIESRKDRRYSPSRTQLLRDAETFQSYRIQSVARDAVDKWCYAAMEAKDQREYMHRVAIAHDKEILLRQAFEHWRLRLHEKKQAAQTHRYFQHLERRATKARDLYLLTKAFTHWVQCASDEALRLSLARQHILSIKYFTAWKDLTVANQDKVHYHGLRKYFQLWRQRYVQNVTNDIKADLAHERYLMRNAYWQWFWGFCEARAPEWQARRLKQRTMIKWLAAFRKNRHRHQQVTFHIETAAKRFFMSYWLKKGRKSLHNQATAVTYKRQTLTASALRSWVRVRTHGPLQQQVSNMVDWRIAGTTFAIFVNRYRQQTQAKSLDKLRLKRNALTQWNDHLRWQTMTRRMDDRCLLETLYKWTIAERLRLSLRLFYGRMKQRYLTILRETLATRKTQRDHASCTLQSQLTRRSLDLVMSHWRLKCKILKQNEQVAVDFNAPRAIHETFQSLIQRLQHMDWLNRRAKTAVFYLHAKHSLVRWRAALIMSRRQKRRDAYIQIRRKSKMRLAREVIQTWCAATAVASNMESTAIQFDQDRILRIVADLFNRWKFAYQQETDQHLQAAAHYEEQLLVRHFQFWSDRARKVTDLEHIALQSAHFQRQRLAVSCLNRLRLRLIELKGPQATAQNLRIRYEKRHFFNMLRLWQEQTAHRFDKPTHNRVTFSGRARRTRLLGYGDDGPGTTARAEEWTELDHDEWSPRLEAQPNSMSLRGYLNTPSKRAQRARAMIQDSTTPTGTPFQTKLRAQLNATPKTTQRSLFGRLTEVRKEYNPAPLGDGSGSTTVIDRDE